MQREEVGELETRSVCVAVHGTVPFLKRRMDEQIGEHGSTKSIIGGENAGGFGIPNKTRGNLSFYEIDETQIPSRFF